MIDPVVVDRGAQPLLVARDIHRHFEGMRAVDGVSIEVPRGQITGLIGPNGAGKSTFMAVLAGTLPATSGSIAFDGRDITHLAPFMRARNGLVRTFQLPSEFARLTVLENLLVAAQDNRGDSLFGALMGKGYWIDDERRLKAIRERLMTVLAEPLPVAPAQATNAPIEIAIAG